MRDLTPAFARLARIAAKEDALYKQRLHEQARMRQIGQKELDRALKPLRLVDGETIVAEYFVYGDRLWSIGIYLRARISYPPRNQGDTWSVAVYFRSVLKTGRPGKYRGYRTFFGATPADAVARLRVVGKAVLPKKGKNDE